MLIMEMALHGWDVAHATGQEYHATDALAAVVEDTVTKQAELFRQYQGFADAVKTRTARDRLRPRPGPVRPRPGVRKALTGS